MHHPFSWAFFVLRHLKHCIQVSRALPGRWLHRPELEDMWPESVPTTVLVSLVEGECQQNIQFRDKSPKGSEKWKDTKMSDMWSQQPRKLNFDLSQILPEEKIAQRRLWSGWLQEPFRKLEGDSEKNDSNTDSYLFGFYFIPNLVYFSLHACLSDFPHHESESHYRNYTSSHFFCQVQFGLAEKSLGLQAPLG